MNLPIAVVDFTGIVDMPQYKRMKDTNLMAKTEHGMGFIEHPEGFPHKDFECMVLFVNLEQHTKQK